MGTINLAGRIPRIINPLSPRLLALGIVLLILAIAVIVYGFRFRFRQQRERKEHQQAQSVASDAATSNRLTVHGEVPADSLGGQPGTKSAPVASVPVPLIGAAKTIAKPFPNPERPASSYDYPTQPRTDPLAEARQKRINHEYEREQQADEAPTGVNQAAALQPASTDSQGPDRQPVQDLRALNDSGSSGQQTVQQPAPIYPDTRMVATPNLSDQPDASQNEQSEKRHFNQSREEQVDDYLKTTRVPPLSRWVIQRGTVIPATLSQKMTTDLPGDLTATVARDVYDSITQKYVMIPAGSRLVGEYNSSVTYAQNRAQVVWIALYFPDGSYIDLDRMPSHSADGTSGLKDQVDNHYKRLIGGVVLSSILAAGIQLSQNHNNGSVLTYPSTTQQLGAAVGSQVGELGQQITSRNLNVQPNIKIRTGDPFSVSVKKDILFPGPYQASTKEN